MKVSQHQQKFLLSSTTNHLKANFEQSLNFKKKYVQQFGDERVDMVKGGWHPEILITGHAGK